MTADDPAGEPTPQQWPSNARRNISVYGPVGLYSVGVGAITPVVPLTATSLGASVALAAVTVGLSGLGTIAGDVPAAALVSRFGDRIVLLCAAAVSAVSLAICAVTPQWWLLAAAMFVNGLSAAVFNQARQSYLIGVTPPARRATALSVFGGTNRIGLLVGPFLGAVAITAGGIRAPFWVALVCTVLAAIITIAAVPIHQGLTQKTSTTVRPLQFVVQHRQVFLTLGLGVLLLGAARAVRVTALPLWSEHIGMSAGTTSVVFGFAGLVESSLFYPAGRLMDRVGRLWVAVPSTLVLAGGLVFLPLTHSLGALLVCALVIGLGNGVGAGIVMTIGADAAPADEMNRFIGIWRMMTDTGVAIGPFLVTFGTALAGLAWGIVTGGSAGLAAALIFACWLPRWSPYARSPRRSPGSG